MNIVKKLNKHTIHYYCDDKIKYYINVPHKEFNNTNISLEFLEDTSKFDPELNDIEWVKSNIIEYYEKVDTDNITLLLPILKKEEKENLLTLNVNKLNLIERLMSLYINSGYITLRKNKINVNNEVFLIENNKFINFIKYFKDKHNSRIIVKKLIEITDINGYEQSIIKNENHNTEIKPFSINENILNETINKNNNKLKEDIDIIENNIPINDLTFNQKNVIENEQKDLINKKELSDNKNIKLKKEEPKLNENNKIKVTNIINPGEQINESKKELEPINNVININDLSSLAAGSLNGTLPGNVTINIEKLVTENNESVKNIRKSDDEADEVSELDEDISDIDEFDENEDFDLDAIDVSEAVLSNDDGNKTYRTVTSGGIKFVVGRKDDDNLKPIEINKNNTINLTEKQNLKIDMPSNIVKGDDQINKDAGFASYFTLFFVAISAIFIIIYIIIK